MSLSSIWSGGSTLLRAAASSTARGRFSSARHSRRMVSSAVTPARAQKRSTASVSASGGTGYSTSPRTRSTSRLVASTRRRGHASTRAERFGAAATTCSRLSITMSRWRSPM